MATKTLDDAVSWSGVLTANTGVLGGDFGIGGIVNFPAEFPYDIDSPVESVLSSTETNDDEEAEKDEEDFLAELTRRLTRSSSALEAPRSTLPHLCHSKPEKPWAVAGSPKSTLAGISGWPRSHGGGMSQEGSPNGGSTAPSPPATPFVAESGHPDWDLIYAAAGQVARLRLNGGGAKRLLQPRHQPIGVPVCPVKSHSPVTAAKTFHSGFCSNGLSRINQHHYAQEEQVPRSCSRMSSKNVEEMNSLGPWNHRIWSRISSIEYENNNRGCRGFLPCQQSRNNQQNQNIRSSRPTILNGSGGVKRECAGTGVFLPRRYENPAPEPRKRSDCSTVSDNVSAQTQHRFNSDSYGARRNAFSAQHEVRLPQDWTY